MINENILWNQLSAFGKIAFTLFWLFVFFCNILLAFFDIGIINISVLHNKLIAIIVVLLVNLFLPLLLLIFPQKSEHTYIVVRSFVYGMVIKESDSDINNNMNNQVIQGELIRQFYPLLSSISYYLLEIGRKDNDPAVRCKAIRYLGLSNVSWAQKPLVKLLQQNNDSNDFQLAVIFALGELKLNKSVKPLINLLNTPNLDEIVTGAIFGAIKKINNPSAIPSLEWILKNNKSLSNIEKQKILDTKNDITPHN